MTGIADHRLIDGRAVQRRVEGISPASIGHIVSKPGAFLLMAEGAIVTVCHHMTRSVAMRSRRSDAVVGAAGKPHLIGAKMIKPGAAVIDIGINQVASGWLGREAPVPA